MMDGEDVANGSPAKLASAVKPSKIVIVAEVIPTGSRHDDSMLLGVASFA
jgi:hypothetical protein